MPIKRQTYRLDQIDDWQGPVQQSGPTRDAAAQRVRDRFAGMSPTERVLSELTERPPTPRAAFPLRENAQTSRPMPPMAGQMFLDAGLGALEALDQPPTGMPAGVPYTTPLRLLSASGAVPSALAARAYDASSRGSVMADAPVVDPLQPADKQSMFSTAIAQRGGGKGAQALGFVADLLTPDVTDAFTGGLLPLAAMAGSLKRVNTGRKLVNGLYSRLDEAASMIPTKGVPATGVLNWLKKAPEGISLEEVAYRKLPEWLESQGTKTVTPEMLAAHLKENPAPFPQVKTLGGPKPPKPPPFSPEDIEVRHIPSNYGNSWEAYDRRTGDMLLRRPADGYGVPQNYFPGLLPRVDEDEIRRQALELGPLEKTEDPTKFSQYQVPGGENYRETLLTLPPKQKTLSFEEFVSQREPGGVERSPGSRMRYSTYLKDSEKQFTSSHYPDDSNLLVHTRSTDRNLPARDIRPLDQIEAQLMAATGAKQPSNLASGSTGAAVRKGLISEREAQAYSAAKGWYNAPDGTIPAAPTGPRIRFGEEAQSDLHQLGAKEGYSRPLTPDEQAELSRLQENNEPVVFGEEIDFDAISRMDELRDIERTGVADLPFKDDWPDLAIKQQLIEAANDPTIEGIGFTGAKTQIDRWGTERLAWEPTGQGDFKVSFEPQVGGNAAGGDMGEEALRRGLIQNSNKTVSSLEDLRRLVGGSEVKAEKAWKRMMAQPEGGIYQPRAEGMTHFYDENTGELRNRAAKIVKPFGGTVEPSEVSTSSQELNMLGSPMFQRKPEPAWLSRLTPEMKAAMRERGFPLMSLAGPVAAQGIPDDPNSETDDYARLALNMGSMAALGMAAKGMAGSAPSGGSLAELASKRMSAAEAEAAGLWHPIGDGKRLAMSVPEMRFQRDIDPVVASRMPDRRVMRLSDLEGSALVPAIGDRSMAGYTLTGVGGVELPNPVKLEGGRDFMRTHSSQGSVWASKKGVVTRITNQIKKAAEASKKSGGTGEVFMVYVPGSHGTTDYSTMMSDALLEQIKGGTFTKKAVREFDAYVRNLRPEWVGLMHPKARTQLDTTTGELRHAFADAVELKSMQDMGFPNIAQTRAAITEPSLMDTPLFSGGSSVAKVDGRIIRDPAIQHSTYDTQMGGTYAGALEKDIPYREMFSDFTAERRASGAPVSGDDRSFQLKFPYQIVTSEWVKKNSGKLQSMGMVAVPVAAGAAAMQSDKPKNGRKTYRLDQIDR